MARVNDTIFLQQSYMRINVCMFRYNMWGEALMRVRNEISLGVVRTQRR